MLCVVVLASSCQSEVVGALNNAAFRIAALVCSLNVLACSETLDAGGTHPHGQLPIDGRNPIILTNDGAYDNWQGEYAVLFASAGGPPLAGIIVNADGPWPSIEKNVNDWHALVSAAHDSGFAEVPEPITSVAGPLTRPASGAIDDTLPNRSEGALFILDAAARLSLPYRPLVIVTGSRLTDVADAYLVDPSVVDRVVVVSSLGTFVSPNGTMGPPNGEMDPWADTIVTNRFRYVQVSSYYDQLTDVPSSRLSELPANALGAWIAAKQPTIYDLPEASDQVAVAAVALPTFAVTVESVSPDANVGPGATAGPNLNPDPNGHVLLVTKAASALASARFWEALLAH